MARYHLGSGAARPNTYKTPRLRVAQAAPSAEPKEIPATLPEDDRQKILLARVRPVEPRLIRELTERGLMRYV